MPLQIFEHNESKVQIARTPESRDYKDFAENPSFSKVGVLRENTNDVLRDINFHNGNILADPSRPWQGTGFTEVIFRQTIIIEQIPEEVSRINGVKWRAYLKNKSDIFGSGKTYELALLDCIKNWNIKSGLPSTPVPKG